MANQHRLSIPLVTMYTATFVFIVAGGALLGLAAFGSTIPAVPPLDALYATLVAIILLLLGSNCLLIAMFLHRDRRRQYRPTGSGRRAQPVRSASGESGTATSTTRSVESDEDPHAPFKPNPDRGSTTDDAGLGTAIRPDTDPTSASTTDATDDADGDENGDDPEYDPHAPFKPDS